MKQFIFFLMTLSVLMISCKKEPIDNNEENGQITPSTLNIEYITVEGGSFQMGCTSTTDHCWDDELPVHGVSVASFQLAKYEINYLELLEFIKSHPIDSNGLYNGIEYISIDPNYDDMVFLNGEFVIKGGKEELVAGDLSWNCAKTFCEWVGGRLPTEAEWEFAARGGNQSQGFVYSGSNDADEVSWNGDNSGDEKYPPGLKMPNELGFYDMTGNAGEWCSDWYDEDYYEAKEGSNPQGPSYETDKKVARGGSYVSGVDPYAVWERSSASLKFTGNDGCRCAKNL